MDAEKFLSEWRRMCKSYDNCEQCPLDGQNNTYDHTCSELLFNESEFAIGCIAQWSKEHLFKSKLDVLKEKLPGTLMTDEGYPLLLPIHVGLCGRKKDCCRCDQHIGRKCWDMEYNAEER